MRVALLGGTGEARELAARLVMLPGVSVETSLAGRTSSPLELAGAVRVGGFAGVDALAAYLAGFDAVVDATHPFAATITAHAVDAAAQAGRPLVVVRRPAWVSTPGDDWRRVPDLVAAAALVRDVPVESVLLTVGVRGLTCFAGHDRQRFVIRLIERAAPLPPLPPRHTLVFARGPYTVDGELELMSRHGVEVLVTKDSGGSAVAAKLAAARSRAIPVVVVDRPPLPPGVRVVDSVAAALGWVVSSSR